MDAVFTSLSSVLLDLTLPQPGTVFASGGQLSGYGWILSKIPIVEATISVAGLVVCSAVTDLVRDDVAAAYPDHPGARYSGFEFNGVLRETPIGPAELVLAVCFADGQLVRRAVPVIIEAGSARQQPLAAEQLGGLQPLSLFLEEAKVDHRGVLALRGWAGSFAPIESITVFAGDVELGAAELGQPRPDVQASYPEYINAAEAGFVFRGMLSDTALTVGSVHVVARAIGGITRRAMTRIEVPTVIKRRQSRDNTIHFNFDIACLTADGALLIVGWAASIQGISAIDVMLDGISLGLATHGMPRPDVGNTHPTIPSARNAGFRFEHQLQESVAGEHVVTLVVRTPTDETLSVPIPVLAMEVAGQKENQLSVATSSELHFFLDFPVVKDGFVAEPLRGMLSIAGWALSRVGIASVDLYLGDQHLDSAYLGIRRQDIAAAFPDWKGALQCGYALVVPLRVFVAGQHLLRVVARDNAGAIEQAEFTITVEPSAEQGGPGSLRSRMLQAEIDLKAGLIAASGLRPAFTIGLRLSSTRQSELRRAKTTLRSIREQYVADWNVLLLLPPSVPSARARDIASQIGAGVQLPPSPAAISLAKAESDVPLMDLVEPWRLGRYHPYFLLLQAGDQLGSDALLEFALQGAICRDADFIYADERRFDLTLQTTTAFFKPEWSPDLLLSTNYIGHPWCADAALLSRTGATLQQIACLGEYDLVLRLTEAARAICHLPLVLSKRARGGIDSPRQERRALVHAMARRGIHGQVLPGCMAGVYRLKRDIMTNGLVSIIIPTIAARGLIKITIDSIRAMSRYRNFEIICIDNIPADNLEWKDWLRHNADKIVLIPETFNWSRFNNRGVEAAEGEFLLFLNDDIEVLDPDWLHALLEHAQREEVGVVGPQLLYPDRKVQHAGLFLTAVGARHAFRFAHQDETGPFGLARTQRNIIGVTGACMMIRRTAFDAAGGFNEAHSVINNDVDYCLRARRSGQRVIFTPHTNLIHHELASRSAMKDVFDNSEFLAEWGNIFLQGDPYFHPALSTDIDTYMPDPEPVCVITAGHPVLARSRVKRILAQKLDHIGDFMTALPALRRIKQRFPHAELHVLVAKASISLAHLEPAIDSVIEFNFFHAVSGQGRRELRDEDLATLRKRLRPYAFDIAIDLRKQADTRPILQQSGAGLLAGFDYRGEQPWLDVAVEWEGDRRFASKRSHVADDLINLVEAVSSACETDRDVAVNPLPLDAAIAAVCALPTVADVAPQLFARRVVCVHPAAGTIMRQWPPEHFAGLIDLLVEVAQVHVVIIGTPAEAPITQAVLDTLRCKDGVWSFVGKTGMRDLPTVLLACDLYIGNNSGPKHIAAGLGVPTVGVHSGVVDAHEWGPLGPQAVALQRKMNCGPCYLELPGDCPRGLACLWGLRPAEVFRVCQQMLVSRSRASEIASSGPARQPDKECIAEPSDNIWNTLRRLVRR